MIMWKPQKSNKLHMMIYNLVRNYGDETQLIQIGLTPRVHVGRDFRPCKANAPHQAFQSTRPRGTRR